MSAMEDSNPGSGQASNGVLRLEAALRAAYRRPQADGGPLPVEAIMEGVRRRADLQKSQAGRDDRFLWRFLSAAAVAAVMLITFALSSGVNPSDVVAMNTLVDDPVSAAWDQPVEF